MEYSPLTRSQAKGVAWRCPARAQVPAAVTVKANPRLADSCRSTALATPNYSYEKRQRELAKKRKVEEKRQRKIGGKVDGDGQPVEGADSPEGDAASEPAASPDTPPAAT
jgi:hypothetical protein